MISTPPLREMYGFNAGICLLTLQHQLIDYLFWKMLGANQDAITVMSDSMAAELCRESALPDLRLSRHRDLDIERPSDKHFCIGGPLVTVQIALGLL